MLLSFVGNIGTYLAAVAGATLTPDAFDTHVSKEAVSPISVLGVGLDSILPLVATGSTLLLMRFTWLVWTAERDPRRRPDGELVSWLLVAAAGIVVPWHGAGVALDRGRAPELRARGGDAHVARVVLVAVRARRCGRGAARRGPRPGTLTSERATAHARGGHGTRMIAHE